MPALSFNEVAVGFDMFGCPNRCRHCFLGALPNRGIAEHQLRRLAGLFRTYTPDGQDRPAFAKVWVSTSIREPDFSDDYRRLRQLEAELSDGKPWRYDLLSVWRLAREPGYAEWARSVGPDTCQITFFGEEQTTDWFCRRQGAFRDNLLATERLLEAGMKPRWQLFANTRGIGEFEALMHRVESMRLRQRAEALGGEFDVFAHVWGADGEALNIEHLLPTLQDIERLPTELLESARRHFRSDVLWRGEAELCREVLAREPWFGYALQPGHMAWFLISGSFDVFFNGMGVEPWWRLGNIAAEPLGTILHRFEDNDTPGLRTIYGVAPQALVRQYGRLDGQRVYSTTDDLLRLYVARHCGWSSAAEA